MIKKYNEISYLDFNGRTFTSDDPIYMSWKAMNHFPCTYEAEFCLPVDYKGRSEVIIGTHGRGAPNVNIEISEDGYPAFAFVDSTDLKKRVIFDLVPIPLGKSVHLAIVRNPEIKKVFCYLNGELRQSAECETPDDMNIYAPPSPCGDYRVGNPGRFGGKIGYAAAYRNVRDELQIASDAVSSCAEGAIFYWDMSDDEKREEFIPDISGNGFDVKRTRIWIDEKEEITDYSYSIAVVGDTQDLAEYYPDKFHCVYDWILDNVKEKNIKFVIGLGDITNCDAIAQWEVASENIKRMDGIVPYSLTRGNHDTIRKFNQYFPYDIYEEKFGGSFNRRIENTWQEFTAEGRKYLVLCLDYGPRKDVVEWADSVIESHPDHNVIITTHSYLFRDGSLLDASTKNTIHNSSVPSLNIAYTDGDYLWEHLAKKHDNVSFVISGHDMYEDIVVTQTKGDHGNTVTQMMVNPQIVDAEKKCVGIVLIMYFSKDGKHVQTEYYSTVRKQFFMDTNQREFDVHSIDRSDRADNEEVPSKKCEENYESVTDLEEKIMLIHDCDSADNTRGTEVRVSSDGSAQGSGHLVGSDDSCAVIYVGLDKLDLSEFKNGSLRFKVYIDDVTKLRDYVGIDFWDADADSKKVAAWFSFTKDCLHNGWNDITARFIDADKLSVDFSKITSFRMYVRFKSHSFVGLDDIRISTK